MDGSVLKGFVAVIQAIPEATTLYHREFISHSLCGIMQDENLYNEKIAQNIRLLRKKNKYSQEYLAELIDRTREHVNRLEKGRETIGFSTFIKLAQIFNVSLDELAGYKTK